MLISVSTLKLLRQMHLYVGVFIAPALLFFAFTGALQTFSLHEATQGSNYKPSGWVVTLGQLHKKQTMEAPAHKARPTDDAAKPERPIADSVKHENTDGAAPASRPVDPFMSKVKTHLAMKLFFLLVAIGLFTSTLSGIVMAYKYSRNKVVITGLLLAGICIPLILTRF